MQKATISISGHWKTVDRIFSTIIGGLPNDESGRKPEISYDRDMSVTTEIGSAGITIAYPDPKPPRPDIPALISAWHARPATHNIEALWHALDAVGYDRTYRLDGVNYRASRRGENPAYHIQVF